ncbi:MAG: L-fucose/L-arabinose isomerase family protein [Planctomycetota bacterium]|nr:MAG: L-fucose/L-arabinose isomerase family protein [Planctomycetota bacterium]
MNLQAEPATSEPFRVGLLAFSDGRLRVHQSLQDTIRKHAKVLSEAIEKDPLLHVTQADEIAYSSKIARRIAKQMRAGDIEATVFDIPVFAFPNYSVLAARVLGLPVLLSSPKEGKLPGLGGIMAAHGAMRQISIKSKKIWGNPLQEPDLLAILSAFCRASGVIERMKGSVYGLIGGRSIGMNTGTVSTQQWMKEFGVDVEHIDQLEIIRRAKDVNQKEVDRGYKWMVDHMGRVSTEGKAQPQHVKEQIRHYLAMRSIIDDFGLDFVGIKCHYDLSEYYVTSCVNAMLLNDPYDWNGPKASTVMACEADSDGALTMQILKLISGYPSLLFDARSYDFENKVLICCNCGAQPSWYAARSDDPQENLTKVAMEPVIPKYGGNGAHFPYLCKEGEITLARMSRVDGKYRMFAARGEFVDFPAEKMAETCSAWPHGYVKMDIGYKEFIDVFNANHLHVVPGDHRQALQIYCELMDIEIDKMGEWS